MKPVKAEVRNLASEFALRSLAPIASTLIWNLVLVPLEEAVKRQIRSIVE